MTPPPVHPLVAAVLAETNDLLPTRHYEQCEAMTALGRATWMPCGCRERQATRQAAAALHAAADHFAAQPGGYFEVVAKDLRDLAAELDPDDPPPPDATEDLDPDELEAGRG